MANTPDLQSLYSQLPGWLGQPIMTPQEQQAEVQRLMAATAPEALRKYGAGAQEVAEGNFGRGFGLSSYNAYQQALASLMQAEGMNKMQVNTQNQVDQAQRAAVANAVNYATSEKNRAQQASMQRAGFRNQRDAQMRGALIQGAGGVGTGVGGMLAKDLMRPQGEGSAFGRAFDRIKGLMGGGGDQGTLNQNDYAKNAGAQGGGTFESEGQGPSEPFTPSYSESNFQLEPGGGVTAPDFGSGYGSGSFQIPEFSLESLYGGFNNIPGNFWDQEF